MRKKRSPSEDYLHLKLKQMEKTRKMESIMRKHAKKINGGYVMTARDLLEALNEMEGK